MVESDKDSGRTRLVVLASMFAMMIAMGSLAFSWFNATCLDGRYCQFTVTEYYVSGDGWREYDTPWGFGEMGGLMGLAVMLVVAWGLLAIAHVGLILVGEKGVVSGAALVTVSVASILVPCAGAEAAIVDGVVNYYSAASSGTVSVSLGGGCILAIIAAALQSVAVVARLLLHGSDEPAGKDEAPPDSNRGDLPVR